MYVRPSIAGWFMSGLLLSGCSGESQNSGNSGLNNTQGSGGEASVGKAPNEAGGAGRSDMTGADATNGSAGTQNVPDAGGSGRGTSVSDTGKVPVPPGPSNAGKPAGSAANLKVLPWAGFKAAVTYTFDDSQPTHVAHFPELKATGIRVTFYMTTVNTWIANYDAVFKEAASLGDELGNHTVNHCNYDQKCNGSKLSAAEEIDDASDYIRSKLGRPDVASMAYPFGDTGYRPDAEARFFVARGTANGMIAPMDETDPYDLPCVAAAGGETAAPFNKAIDDAHSQGKWVIFLFHSLLPGDNWYAGLPIGSVTDSMQHAKALPDVWIDTVANVAAYWLGQKLVVGGASGASAWKWKLPAHFPKGRYVRVTVDGGTLKQGTTTLEWDPHGYYEVALDAEALSWQP